MAAKLHCEVKGRGPGGKSKDADYVQDGAKAITAGKVISKWQARRKCDESVKEEWAEDNDNMLDG